MILSTELCVLLLVLIITLLDLWFRRGLDYFKKQNIPFIKPWPIFGSQPSIVNKIVGDVDIENAKIYGKTWGQFAGRAPHLFTTDRDLIKRVLIKDTEYFPNRRHFPIEGAVFSQTLDQLRGEKWKIMRTGLTPIFTSGKLTGMVSTINGCAADLVRRIDQRLLTTEVGRSTDLPE